MKKIDVRDLVHKIERLTRERMTGGTVVALEDLRKLRQSQISPLILVIEDDEAIRTALRRVFEADNCRVRTAADGTELAQVLDDTKIDLIICDVGLPWINGLELGQMMKAHPDLKKIPLIFISGHTSPEDIKKGFDVGADDYVKKPFDLNAVRKTVRTLIELSR